MQTIEEFVQEEIARTGKRIFTVPEVIELAERYRRACIANAAPFVGWLEGEALEQAKQQAVEA